ncbi:hypothetical protein HO133_006066 [Letharia lupina]|uniref:Uncharacterized protein n=1 Tax=Letharia lupina TaxID=560253 RepID=A0A8H6C7B4_9LECA|nr:uncharacterized protein HO133_006066 [Letharia lupina]KAF6218108.1 hypothetical protein HO133_006066 [Letharia lupina]
MWEPRTASAIAALLSITNAFTLDFNSAGQCTGATIGEFVGTVGSGCQTQFFNVSDSNILIPVEGGSDNVLITPNVKSSPSDKNSAVAWYGEANCQTLIALGNVPVCLGVGNYESFQVIDITDVGFTYLDPAGVVEMPPNATETATKGEVLTEPGAVSTPASSAPPPPATTSAKPAKMRRETTKKGAVAKRGQSRQASHMTNAKRMTHGAVHSAAGQEWKFQQIASRVFRGVNPATWNDNIHKRSSAELEAPISLPALSPLQSRALSDANCNFIRTCMVDSGDSPTFNIASAGAPLLSAIQRLNTANTDDWSYLQSPTVVEVVDESGKTEGYIYAVTLQHSENVNTCSDQATQRDVLQAALAQGAEGSSVTDMQVALQVKAPQPAGETNLLFVSTRSATNQDMSIHPVCEAVVVDF